MKLLFIATVCVLLAACSEPPPASKPTEAPNPSKILATADSILAAAPASAWDYSEEEDKMTSKKIKYAEVIANEPLQLKFPYGGGSIATILIRNRRGDKDVVLRVTKGQFMTKMDGTPIEVRFDDKQAIPWYCSESSDGDNSVLFIRDEEDFIAKLKKAKKMIIEAELFENGVQQMEFDVAGFIPDSVFPRERVARKRKTDGPIGDPKHPLERVDAGVH